MSRDLAVMNLVDRAQASAQKIEHAQWIVDYGYKWPLDTLAARCADHILKMTPNECAVWVRTMLQGDDLLTEEVEF